MSLPHLHRRHPPIHPHLQVGGIAGSLVKGRRTPPARMTEVGSGVYAWIQDPGGWCLSNAGVLVGREGAVVIDTLATESRARELVQAVHDLQPGPARTVVNTHHHGDHTFGNYVFGPGAARPDPPPAAPASADRPRHAGSPATIVAHEHARAEMTNTGTALINLWPGVEWGDVRVTLPTITFRHELTLYVDDRRAELLHVGPAHTTNDVVVWLPEDRVLFAGDVALNGSTPFNLMGSVAGALVAIERLRTLDAVTVVCGHGAIARPEVFTLTTDYLLWIQQLALDGVAAGLSPLEVACETDLGPFVELLDPERLVGNLHRAYAELEPGELGRPLDVAPIFSEMIEFNGGILPTCLA